MKELKIVSVLKKYSKIIYNLLIISLLTSCITIKSMVNNSSKVKEIFGEIMSTSLTITKTFE